MKGSTIEHYIRHTDMDYPEIIERALKHGWKKTVQYRFNEAEERMLKEITMTSPAGEVWETAYSDLDPKSAYYNIYSWPKR